MFIGSRVQVLPVGQVPVHWLPQPSLWPHMAFAGQLGTHTQRRMVRSHDWFAAHMRPVPHEGPPAQRLGMSVPHATVFGSVVGHPGTHWQRPDVQVVPVAQVVPHAPQLALSVLVLTQRPLQSVCPLGHWQRPAVQVVPEGQTVPQVPQFDPSVWRFTQRPLQRVVPLGHWHVPPVHTWVVLVHIVPVPHDGPPAHTFGMF